MGRKRKNGEGTWGTKTIKGVKYKYYRDPSGKYFYGKTDKEINEKRNNYNANKITERTTFGDYLLWYFNTIHKPTVEPTTHAEYIRICNTIINNKYYKLKDIHLCSFGVDNNYFKEYIAAITPHYALNTIQGQVSKIKMAVRYAEKTGKIERGLLDDIKTPKKSSVGTKERKIPFLPKEIADELYNHIYDEYKHSKRKKYGYYYWVMLFIIHTGLRTEEVRALRLNDIDFKNKEVCVDEAMPKIQKEDGTYEYFLKGTKNEKSTRVVPLNKIAIEMITLIINYTKPQKSTDFIFFNRKTDTYLNNHRLCVATNRILNEINSPILHCNPHALRHTFGSILYEQGVGLKTISELLGHSNIKTTADIYISLTKKHLGNAVLALEPDYNNKKEEDIENGKTTEIIGGTA